MTFFTEVPATEEKQLTEFKGVFVWTILRELTIIIKNKNPPQKKFKKTFEKLLTKKKIRCII